MDDGRDSQRDSRIGTRTLTSFLYCKMDNGKCSHGDSRIGTRTLMSFLYFQVWSIENPDWYCKVDEGSAGLCAVRWAPDGRHVLTTADFHVGDASADHITQLNPFYMYLMHFGLPQ